MSNNSQADTTSTRPQMGDEELRREIAALCDKHGYDSTANILRSRCEDAFTLGVSNHDKKHAKFLLELVAFARERAALVADIAAMDYTQAGHSGGDYSLGARTASQNIAKDIRASLPQPTAGSTSSAPASHKGIKTEHLHPPIPTRSNDWVAYRGDPDGAPDGRTWLRGYGTTEQEAIDDLLEQEIT